MTIGEGSMAVDRHSNTEVAESLHVQMTTRHRKTGQRNRCAQRQRHRHREKQRDREKTN